VALIQNDISGTCVSTCVDVVEWDQSDACLQQVGSYQRRCTAVRQPRHHRLPNSSSYIYGL